MKYADVSNSVKALVETGVYQTEEEVVQDALSYLIQSNPEYRIKLAVYRYQHEEISIGKAAEIAGVSIERMKEIFIKHGIQPRLGAQTVKEAREEAKVIRRYLNELHRQ